MSKLPWCIWYGSNLKLCKDCSKIYDNGKTGKCFSIHKNVLVMFICQRHHYSSSMYVQCGSAAAKKWLPNAFNKIIGQPRYSRILVLLATQEFLLSKFMFDLSNNANITYQTDLISITIYYKYHVCCFHDFNSSPPSAAYMPHWWTGSALVQVMACTLSGAKSLLEPMLVYSQLDP